MNNKNESDNDLSVEQQVILYKKRVSQLVIQNKIGKLDKPDLIKKVKKQIARLLTKNNSQNSTKKQ